MSSRSKRLLVLYKLLLCYTGITLAYPRGKWQRLLNTTRLLTLRRVHIQEVHIQIIHSPTRLLTFFLRRLWPDVWIFFSEIDAGGSEAVRGVYLDASGAVAEPRHLANAAHRGTWPLGRLGFEFPPFWYTCMWMCFHTTLGCALCVPWRRYSCIHSINVSV